MTATVETPPTLAINNVTAGYGRTVVLRDVSIEVHPGSVVALLGPNGAGKTTTLRVASGLLRPREGTVSIKKADVTRKPPHEIARAGLCLIPEGRGIFRSLTVAENLRLQLPPWASKTASYDRALEAFPVLAERLHQQAGSLSGGQQQMVALARAYVSSPSVVLLDEVSMGLAPALVDEIFVALRTLAASGTALLLVEQYVNLALDIADHVVLLEKGSVAFSGSPSDLSEDALLRHYLGTEAEMGTGEPS
ncbi:MAG: ABC transporter ATP-binding protein [Thermoleophilia bacterium]